ncbi:hypothetical protein CDCA_CDCA15G4082 [Cyanidium caldarium]|uniref:Glycosyltransferase RgtA/B/C/D-like domain-containing protein n=1 Tax=Cyanidium caldarium TaxID=2771 RepID=A0AAV9J0G7_CYACA|nr:hypothetical protein CDCA_CDCA15G4082 [Cyanidium caldarium]
MLVFGFIGVVGTWSRCDCSRPRQNAVCRRRGCASNPAHRLRQRPTRCRGNRVLDGRERLGRHGTPNLLLTLENRDDRQRFTFQRAWQATRSVVVPRGRRLGPVLLILWVCYWNFWRGNGDFSIMDNTEPKFAICARNMIESGDWLTPTWNGNLRFDKPPLVYWLQALAYLLFGYTEWATRLPTALAATAAVAVVYALGARFDAQRWRAMPVAGLTAALAAAANLYAVGWARSGVSDMVLCATITAALACFFCGYASAPGRARRWWYWAFFVFTALAVLTKGPLGAFLPAAIANLFLLAVGQWRAVALHEMPLGSGIGIASAIALPWYVLIVQRFGVQYVRAFFGYHNLARLTTAVNAHGGPWYYYVVCLAVGFFPWSVWLPALAPRVASAWRERSQWRQRPRPEQLELFLMVWFGWVLLFFSGIRTKLFSYILPGVPAAALLIGMYVARQFAAPARTSRPLQHTWPALVASLGMAGAAAFCGQVAHWVHTSSGGGGDPWIIGYCLRQIREQHLGVRGALPWLLGAVSLLPTVSSAAAYRWAAVPCAVAFMAFQASFLMPCLSVWDAAHQRPLRMLAERVYEERTRAPRTATRRVYMLVFGWCDGAAEGQPSVVWYSRCNRWHFAERAEETLAAIVAEAAAPDGAARAIPPRPAAAAPRTAAELRALVELGGASVSGDATVLVLADDNLWHTVPGGVAGAAPVARSGPFVLYRVRVADAYDALCAVERHGGTLPFRRRQEALSHVAREPAPPQATLEIPR